jgi:hypothetical protein
VNLAGAALLLLLLPLSAAAADKSVADMTAAELEVYLGKGKQSQFEGLIKQARDYKNPASGVKVRELYTRLTTLKPVDGVEAPALTAALSDPAACWDILCSSLCENTKCGPVCRAAASAAEHGEPPPKEASVISLEMIKAERAEPRCRGALIDGLGAIGPSASSATAVLAGLLSEPPLRCRAARALGRITPALGKAERADCAARPASTKTQAESAREILTAAVRCRLAEKKLASAAPAAYDAAFSSGKKLCDSFTADYGEYLGRWDGGAQYLWRFCGEKYKPELCAPLQRWLETHD